MAIGLARVRELGRSAGEPAKLRAMQALAKLSLLLIGAATLGCSARHVARVDAPRNAPPVERAVLHASRLWIELRHHTADKQCRHPRGERGLCFVEVHQALG